MIRRRGTVASRARIFDPVLAAYPDFRPKWQAFADQFAHLPEGPPWYVLLGDLARDCSALLRSGREAELAAIMAAAEGWIVHGDHWTHEAAIVGFLEDLQNTNLHDGTVPDDYLRFLGPESTYWWHRLNGFWQQREPLIDPR